MNENKEQKFKIILQYVKDLSIETPNVSTLTYVRENLTNYIMDIDISSSLLKNKALEIITKLTLQDKKDNSEKAFFEIKYASVITFDDSVKNKNDISKIVLCDLQKIIYPKLEKMFLGIIKEAGYPDLKFEKKVDFEKLYNEKFN
tara:strand:+ start:410 stop:844 length:435 start_codon:yes stop_codon:yes gene_type:complete